MIYKIQVLQIGDVAIWEVGGTTHILDVSVQDGFHYKPGLAMCSENGVKVD